MARTHGDQRARSACALSLLLALGGSAAACGDDDGGKETDSGAQDGGGGGNDGGMVGGDGGKDGGKDAGGPPPKTDAGPVDPSVPGEMAPTLGDAGVAYYDDELGPRVLIKGRDPNGDVQTYTMHFQYKNDAGMTMDVPIDPDGPLGDKPASADFTADLKPTPNEATFYALLEQTSDFASAVNSISLFVKDQGGRMSNTLTAVKRPAPTVTGGGTCDPYGFNRCESSRVCVKASPSSTSYSCQPITSARTNACTAALTLSPPDTTTVYGTLTTTSLWDAPTGCTNNDPKRKADSVVKLHLAAAAAKVILSTDNPWTDITDTVLYRLSSCESDAPACPSNPPCSFCADDISDGNRRSRLELTNLAAGDYFFVVDSFPTAETSGVSYELSVVVE